MSERQRIHGHADEDEELPKLPTPGSLTSEVPTAPDPDLTPGGTKEIPDPPGRDVAAELPE